MRTDELTEADRELIEAAELLLRERFEAGRHRCAAAVRTESGAVYTGINLLPELGVAGVHSEPIAIGTAVADGESTIATSVAVVFEDDDPTGPTRVVSPCGCCRELMRSFAPSARVVVSRDGARQTVPIDDLLPVPN